MHTHSFPNKFKPVLPLAALLMTSHVSQAAVTFQNFDYTGADQSFVVPAGVMSISFEVLGGKGGNGDGGSLGGNGHFITGSLSVTPGSSMTIRVGGRGHDSHESGFLAFGGGGFGSAGESGDGGGLSGIFLGMEPPGHPSSIEQIISGGGGGGGGASSGTGGHGGSAINGNGSGGNGLDGNGFIAGSGGLGGDDGGWGGPGGSNSDSSFAPAGTDGVYLSAGVGGGAGGGGGGGLLGGGGGGAGGGDGFSFGGGGGGGAGSSFIAAGASGTILAGANTASYASTGGNGSIVISYDTVPEPSSLLLLALAGFSSTLLRKRS